MSDGSKPRLSRRSFLGALPVAAIVAACSKAPAGSTHNVLDHGALGNGIHDDAGAIGRAAGKLKSGDTLRFPQGTYRFALQDPAGGAAISLRGLSDVTIEFESGAELLMDNLDQNGRGTSHGVVVRGPASGVSLCGVVVRWSTQPSERSMGDGIRIVGYPSESREVPSAWTGSRGPVSGVTLRNCRIRASPQAGVIMMGVSGITVTDLQVQDTLADGLHFNACRDGDVRDYVATNTGDDGLALVTYHTDEDAFDNSAETFSLSELTEWSGADLTANNVVVNGSNANGVRLAGANRVTLTDIKVRGVRSGAGVIIDSAAPGSDADWNYVASRAIKVQGLVVDESDSGLHVLARPNGSTDDRFSRFDLDVSDVTVRSCPRWSLLVESVTDEPVTGVRLRDCTVSTRAVDSATGIVGLQTTRGMTLGKIAIDCTEPAIAFSANASTEFELDELRVSVSGPGPDPGAAEPLALFQDSAGSVVSAQISWPQAPSPWTPISVSGAACNDSPVADGSPVLISRLTTTPSATALAPADKDCQ